MPGCGLDGPERFRPHRQRAIRRPASGNTGTASPSLAGIPTMEGTLGAAERAPLRGGGREAALTARRPSKEGGRAAGFAKAGSSGLWTTTAKAGDGRSSGRFVKGASRRTSRVAGLSSVQLTDLRQKVPESTRIGVSPSTVLGLVY
jgi:hypothetical protein